MGFITIAQYVLLGLFPIFEISCYGILRSRRSDIAIRKRNTAMLYMSTIAAWLTYANLIFSIFGGYSCGMYHAFLILVQPLSIGPQLLRGITLRGMFERNKLMLKYGKGAPHLRRTLRIEDDSRLKAIEELSSSKYDEAPVEADAGIEGGSTKEDAILAVRQKMRLLVKVAKIILIGLPSILILIMLLVTDRSSLLMEDFDLCFQDHEFILNIGRIFSVAFIIAAIVSIMLIRHCNDELGIRREIVRNIAIVLITNITIFVTSYYYKEHDLLLILYIVQQISLSFSMIIIPCWESAGCSNQMLDFIKSRNKSATPAGYGRPIPNMQVGRSSLIIKARESLVDKERQREMTMSLDAGLCILLSSNEGIDAFTEHCSREFSVENIQFWLVITDFHKALDILRAPTCDDKSDHDESDIRAFADEIYTKYVKVGSELQINISSAQRNAIERALEKSGKIERSIFDNAQKEVYALMSRHSYPRYLASQNQESKISQASKSKRSSIVLPSGR